MSSYVGAFEIVACAAVGQQPTGTREIVRNIVAGFYTRKFLAVGQSLEIAGNNGILTAITATHTILNHEGQDIMVANATFLDQTSKQ